MDMIIQQIYQNKMSKFHHITIVSSIGSKYHIVHGYKIKSKSKHKHSINASFREVNQICKMGNKKVRRRRLEEEEEEKEED